MKKELIKTGDYLLVVDDSVINLDDWVYTDTEVLFQYGIEHELNPSTKKVIAHLPFGMYSTLEGVPLLPPIEDDDVWSMGLEARLKELPYTKHLDDGMFNDGQVSGFESGAEWGYNKAREKYKFTEEDMINFACKVYNENYDTDDSFFTTAETLIKSFSQPKTPTHFEFEIESKSVLNLGIEPFNPNTHVYTNEPKTTTNSQGQQIVCGKYIY